MSPGTRRALRTAALRLAQARQDFADAIVDAHAGGADIGEIGRELRMDLFDVRDVLGAAGALPDLKPKEAAARKWGLRSPGPPADGAAARE